jgi:cytochrome c oxidase subunit 4
MNHRVTARTHLFTWLGLLALSGLTFGLSFVPLGPAETPAALVIAAAKGLLIVLFFMHLVEQRATNALVLVFCLLMLLLLAGLAVADVLTRPAMTIPLMAR